MAPKSIFAIPSAVRKYKEDSIAYYFKLSIIPLYDVKNIKMLPILASINNL